ncbi:MAG: hypothetical protein JXB33_10750 [Clostridia bacterium]|nr:hypothetical protein [Clostridia bacterium]
MKDSKSRSNVKNILTIVVLAAVAVLLAWGWFGTSITAEDNAVKITGFSGQKVEYSEILTVELHDIQPIIMSKTVGFSVGAKKLGTFKTEEYGTAHVYLQNSGGPFIVIGKTDGKWIILNTVDSSETMALYDEIVEKYEGARP